jgi:hypothetical protein
MKASRSLAIFAIFPWKQPGEKGWEYPHHLLSTRTKEIYDIYWLTWLRFYLFPDAR